MYTFDQYSADIEPTRKGVHNTTVYNCLGLIGELGELVSVVREMLSNPSTPDEEKVLLELEEFIFLAKGVESLKKQIRKSQIPCFPNVKIENDNIEKALTEEFGGVLWYLDSAVVNLKLTLTNVAFTNQLMLKHRFATNPNWMLKGVKTH